MEQTTLILPIAGASSRFPNVRPKWMLTHPKGTLMLTEAIRGLHPEVFVRIIIVCLQQHEDQYKFSEELVREISEEYKIEKNKIMMCYLENPTRNQAETVYMGITRMNVEGSILVKDSDNYFEFDVRKARDNNFVVVSDLHSLKHVNAGNKGYVKIGENNTVVNIAEKKVIGNLFCCGAYCFKSADEFVQAYMELSENDNLYLSHIIYKMILDKQIFFVEESHHYLDWGTMEDWMEYKNTFSTLFIDLDGILVKNSGEHFEPKWGTTPAIEKNVEAINALYDTGRVIVIITTARKHKYQKITEEQLSRANVKYHQMIMDLPSAKRVLINDYSKTNPYRSAIAINIERNSENLSEMLGELK